jgi:glycosyltransferase 2 family protein
VSKFLRIGVSVALLAILAWRIDWPRVAQAVANLHWGYWLGAVAILVVTQVVSAWRWQLQARTLGLNSSLTQMTGYYFIGMFFNLILPTSVGGDVVRAYYITGPTGKRLPGFVSVLVDRLNGLIVLLVLASVATAVQYHKVPGWVSLFVWGTTLCAVAGIAILPLLARWGQHGDVRVKKVRALLQMLRQPRLLLQTTALSLIIQVANIVLVWQVGLALSLESSIGFDYYWILVPMVSVLTLLPVSLNGMGVREWGMAMLLEPLGVSETAAVTLSFLWFLVFICASLLGGLAYMSGRFTRVPKLTEDGAENGSVDHHSDQGRTRQLDQAA